MTELALGGTLRDVRPHGLARRRLSLAGFPPADVLAARPRPSSPRSPHGPHASNSTRAAQLRAVAGPSPLRRRRLGGLGRPSTHEPSPLMPKLGAPKGAYTNRPTCSTLPLDTQEPFDPPAPTRGRPAHHSTHVSDARGRPARHSTHVPDARGRPARHSTHVPDARGRPARHSTHVSDARGRPDVGQLASARPRPREFRRTGRVLHAVNPSLSSFRWSHAGSTRVQEPTWRCSGRPRA